MKDWWKFALGVISGLLGAGVILLVGSSPRGELVTLMPPPTPLPILVHVVGAIATPGVYSLPPDSRLQDAVHAAGGLLPEADTDSINLAAMLQDGSRVVIPWQLSSAQKTEPSADIVITPPSFSKSQSLLININTATQAELETLPGIGPVIAQKIIEYREAYGPFTTIEDIMKVSGIGPKIFEKIKDLITVGP